MKAALKKTFRSPETMKPDHPLPTSLSLAFNLHALILSAPPPRQNPATLPGPSPTEILRYRHQHSTNLGGIFVLEKWLHPSMFDANCTGDSELDAVTASIGNIGLEHTRKRWEEHWEAALSMEMLEWLASTAHCTTIRLPVGYFTLGSKYCDGTPFERVAGVYDHAWDAVRKLVARCLGYGIGVLLDFHALPGGANGEAHSGTSSGRAGMWGRKGNRNREKAGRCLEFMAGERMEGVVGIQVCNEAEGGAEGLWRWYDEVVERIEGLDGGLPVYVSDAWDLGRAMQYAVGRNGVRGTLGNPVVVDTHRYYTFAQKDISRSPQQIIAQIPGELAEVATLQGNVFEKKGACDVFVGEYSCTLDHQTWKKTTEDRRAALIRQFGQAQCIQWQQKSCGSAFWTLSMDWMPGGDWGFEEQVNNGNITAPEYLSIPSAAVIERGNAAERVRDNCMTRAVEAHMSYWDGQARGKIFEHRRFVDGWKWGWTDARDFFLARSRGILSTAPLVRANGRDGTAHRRNTLGGGDKIGLMELWVLKRMKEAGCSDKERCHSGWEFEQGFRQGVAAFYSAAGI